MPTVPVLVSGGLNDLSLGKDKKLLFKEGLVVMAASFTV